MFRSALGVQLSAAQPLGRLWPAGGSRAGAGAKMKRARVLVVDDDRSARDALRELLSDAGYDVLVAADGVEGLALVDSFRPTVLVTDVRMPKMDGQQLAAASRQRLSPPSVVFMSAYPRPHNEQSPWLSKPLDLGALLSAISRIVEGRG